jgi:hypothetical protein
MLARAIAREPSLPGHRIVLVVRHWQRARQIVRSVRHWGEVPLEASTGMQLAQILRGEQSCLVLTVTGKLDALLAPSGQTVSESPGIFVLIDRHSPAGYQELCTRARKVLPGASMILFSDTPPSDDQRHAITSSGGLLETCAAAGTTIRHEHSSPATGIYGLDPGTSRASEQLPAYGEGIEQDWSFGGVIRAVLAADGEMVTTAAQGIEQIIRSLRVVGWTESEDIQNQMRIAIEDLLFDIQERYRQPLSFDQIDAILERCLAIARRRLP